MLSNYVCKNTILIADESQTTDFSLEIVVHLFVVWLSVPLYHCFQNIES